MPKEKITFRPPLLYSDEENKYPISIIVGKEGAFFRTNNVMYETTVPLEEKNLNLESVEEATYHTLPVISFEIYCQTLSFFRAVYKKYQGEAMVILVMKRGIDLNKQEYKIIIPRQEVSGAHIDYKTEELEKGYFYVGTIHSHPSFGASQSSIDSEDEINFDGVHLTFGHIERKVPEIHSRFCFGGQIFDAPKMIITQSNIPDQFPKEWLEKVSEKKVVVTTHYYGNNFYASKFIRPIELLLPLMLSSNTLESKTVQPFIFV